MNKDKTKEEIKQTPPRQRMHVLIDRRIEEIAKVIIKGGSIGDCWELQEKHGVGDRQFKNYIAAARTKLAKLGERNLAEEQGKALMRFEDLYGKLYAMEDYKSCIMAQEKICNVLGIRNMLTNNIENGSPLPDIPMTQRARDLTKELYLELKSGDKSNVD